VTAATNGFAFPLGWLRLARPRDWWQSKVPFQVVAVLLLAPGSSLAQSAAMICAVAAWASFGYGLNDIADRRSDAVAGKNNHAVGLSRLSRAVFLLVAAGISLGLSLVWAADIAAPLFVLAGLALTVVYSAPPVRLKERGFAGIAAAALAQWTLPVLAISAAEPHGWLQPASVSMALLGFALGVRWMGVHQLVDLEKDRSAGVQTFAALGQPVFRLIVTAFAAELALLAILILARPESMVAAATLVVWVAAALVFRTPAKGWRQRVTSYEDAPLSGYYFIALPAVLVLSRLEPAIEVWTRAAVAVLLAHCLLLYMRRRRALRQRYPA
jgi:4-hydroxybenzoate polyprenyltransferase